MTQFREIEMKRFASILMVAVLVLGFSGSVFAGDDEVVMEGKVVCAKCALHEENREECQNVLVVGSGDEVKHFYLAANKVNEDFGDVCMATPGVKIAGTLSEKGGHQWLTASKIEKLKKS